jgi:deazaflavin-dependent oxidoreductase (nitroreductase family)
MPKPLRYVDPHRRRGAVYRAWAALSGTRPMTFLSRKIGWKLDPLLHRVTGGRLGLGFLLPTAVLETTGAKTGARRRNALIYFHDGDEVTIVASKAGAPTHPAWYHNLRSHPDVTFGGVPMRAAVVTDAADIDRLWPLADNVFPVYARYRRDAAAVGRTIPLVQLSPQQ